MRPRFWMLAAVGAALALVLAPATRACADDAAAAGPAVDVAVLPPAADDRILVEAAARVRLELGASGLTSAPVDAAGDAYAARLAFVREDGVATIDLLATLADGSSLDRRVPVPRAEGGDDPAVLALRAAEVLRGMRLAARRAPPAPAPTAAPAEPPDLARDGPPPVEEALPVRLFAGAAALEGRIAGPGAGVAPGVELGASAPVARHVSIVVVGAGPFYRDLAPRPGGSAHTREELAYLGLLVEGRLRRVDVHALFATGAHHLRAAYDARGVAPGAPDTSLHLRDTPSFISPFVAVGVGASRALWRRSGLSVELDAVVLQPSIDVFVDGRVVGGAGAPSWLQTLDFWVAFP